MTFCFSPSESVCTFRLASAVMPTHDRHLSTIFLSFSVSLPQKPVYGLRPMLTISSAVMFFMPLLSVSTTLITLASSAALLVKTSVDYRDAAS